MGRNIPDRLHEVRPSPEWVECYVAQRSGAWRVLHGRNAQRWALDAADQIALRLNSHAG